MSLENPPSPESIPQVEIEIEKGFDSFVPSEFKDDPFRYFETEGINIKSGEVEYDADGAVIEDPTATKDLPVWRDEGGTEIHVVGKKVNTVKSQVGKSEDPFYEYKVMEIAKEFELPAPKPIAKAKRGDEHLIVMEKVEGLRWTDNGMRPIHKSDLTDADKEDLLSQAQSMIDDIQAKYEEVGLHRNWKMKDMIFNVDIANKKVLSVVPTDWEGTKIDKNKLQQARQRKK